jgi:hypothetical protein
MLSPYNINTLNNNKVKYVQCNKLIPNLRNKHKYKCHYSNLQLYLSLGLKVNKIQEIISFDQEPWMKNYIDFNTEQRKKSRNKFEKDFYKLTNNAIFGKTMKNIRNQNSVMDFQSKRRGISKFWMKKNLKKQKKTFLRQRIVFIKFLTG